MSSSDVSVELWADNPLADILLLDGSFHVVARGASPLKALVPAGLYAVKVKIGDEETEELMELTPNPQPVVRNFSAPRFSSPIPLEKTDTSREYHQAAASRYLGGAAPQIALGEGAAVMICVRDPS